MESCLTWNTWFIIYSVSHASQPLTKNYEQVGEKITLLINLACIEKCYDHIFWSISRGGFANLLVCLIIKDFSLTIVKKIWGDPPTCTMPGIELAQVLLSLLLMLSLLLCTTYFFILKIDTASRISLSQSNHLFRLDDYVNLVFALTIQKVKLFLLNILNVLI